MEGWQEELLRQARVARLATVDEYGQPHIVPVCFAYLDGSIYTPIDEKPKRGQPANLRRIRNIQANGRATLLVDRYDEDWTKLAWLQLRGTAAVVEMATERIGALGALRSKYPQYRAMALEGLPLIRLEPARVVGWLASAF